MRYVPSSFHTLPLNVRQAVADQQHSPRRDGTDPSREPDKGIEPWGWMLENWGQHDWEDWARGNDINLEYELQQDWEPE